MTKNILLVGLEYTGTAIPDVKIETLGLCRATTCREKAAFALYEYDAIVINPASYSHFIFGTAGEFSDSENELWDLKRVNNDYDLDTVFDAHDRGKELTAAIRQGTRVIWLLAEPKSTKFFGRRSVYAGYVHGAARRLLDEGELYSKKSRRVDIDDEADGFGPYFNLLSRDGWGLCLDVQDDSLQIFARSLEGYCIGGRVAIEDATAWLLTPPPNQEAADLLVQCVTGLDSADVARQAYHGIFLSHTSADKPFVRELKQRLHAHGVTEIWLDEAEIQIGDSLTKKIEEGMKKTRYIGVVLSEASIRSPWVERELDIAINREIATGEVVVLPLLYQKCKLPAFLQGKLYADFTSPAQFDESLDKLLRRLKIG